MNLIIDERVKALKETLQKNAEGLWCSVEMAASKTELLVILNLRRLNAESIKKTYDVFRPIFLNSEVFRYFLAENFQNWSTAIYHDGKSVDSIFRDELLADKWESDYLDFPYYLEKTITKSVKSSSVSVAEVSLEMTGEKELLVNVHMNQSRESITEAVSLSLASLKSIYTKSMTDITMIVAFFLEGKEIETILMSEAGDI